jgi:choline dehydrogenase-like flavoprotein
MQHAEPPARPDVDGTGYDLVVVGSGIAGALIAYQLARAGAKVLVLEAGERATSRRALVEQYARSPSKYPSSPYVGLVAPQPYQSDPRRPLLRARNFGGDYFVQDRRAPPAELFMSDYLNLAGGSTWHWQGLWLRMLPNDFRMETAYGVGRDWPLTYHDLERWYSLAEQLLGVAGDHAAFDGLHGAVRGAPFPMPPIAPSFGDRRIMARLAGATFDGVPLEVTTIPQAKNSVPYDGRRACEGRSSCIPLCPIDAKYEARIHLERAERHGVELRTRCVVTKLETAGDGRISRVHYRRWTGTATRPTSWVDREVSGRIVVLAANGIETPRLLLHSRLATRSDQVGRNLMDHPIKIAWALAVEPVHPFRGPPSTSSIESLRDGPFRRERGAFRTSFRNDGWAVATGAPRGHSLEPPPDPAGSLGTVLELVGNRGLFGRKLVTALREHASRQVLIGTSVEMLPRPENRVTLDPTRRDRLGLPRPRIDFQIDEYTRAAFRAANRLHAALFDAIGVAERYALPDAEGPDGGAGHIIGTTVMGDSPETSVVDHECRAHEHGNLFVVGSSVFPTASSANSTATIAALALRAADTIRRELGGPSPDRAGA